MPRKASIFRLDPDTQAALANLGKLMGRPMNKLVNEAVRDYLLKTSPQERDLEARLASLSEYRRRDAQLDEAATAMPGAHVRYVNDDPAETTVIAQIDPETIHAAREFVRRVSARYPVQAAILFGSRARGNHRADSDADVAVVLRGTRGKFMDMTLELVDIAFDVLLETNVYIQPLPVWDDEWQHPETHPNPRLLENIRREGVIL